MNTPTLDLTSLLAMLPVRDADAHKGNFGHVLVVGSDYGYPGAAVLAALGALRVGAGLVTIATHGEHIIGLNSSYPEIMATPIDTPSHISNVLTKATVIVLGPGLGRSKWSREVFKIVIDTKLPLVLDADGLFLLTQMPHQHIDWVLTPHPGEATTLLHISKPITANDRMISIQKLIQQYNATVVLKGAGTLVGSPDKKIEICHAGNPGMASGGMGDLLSGVIAGLIAQGMSLDSAAKLGVCLHATAGDLAAQQGQRGMLATDLLPHLRLLVTNIQH